MNQAHLHLIFTHLPIFGSILGGIVLAQGLSTKSNHTKMAGYSLLIISAIGAVISYLTGEPAEELVENVPGIASTMIEQHEEFAMFALIALCILGVISLAGLFLTQRSSPWSKSIATIALMVCMVSFGLVGWTGYLGGQIRHTELNTVNGTVSPEMEMEDDD